jgi:hypothetical protein
VRPYLQFGMGLFHRRTPTRATSFSPRDRSAFAAPRGLKPTARLGISAARPTARSKGRITERATGLSYRTFDARYQTVGPTDQVSSVSRKRTRKSPHRQTDNFAEYPSIWN